MLREYKLPKANVLAAIEVLEPRHLPMVLELQDATRAALPEDQKMFVLPQKPEYFEKLLARKNGLMVGISVKGKMIAQIAAMGAFSLEEAITRNAITRNEISFHHAEPAELVAVAKSMAVHPQWRGNELSQHLVQAMLDIPAVRAADHVFAQMSAANVRSWELFLKNGFGIIAASVDPIDHMPRFILQKPALRFAFYPAPSAEAIDPAADFTSIMRLTEHEALIGQIDAIEPAKLSFFASSDTAAAWTDEPVKRAR
jgi:ribosomal protein S18 acetylase RimI-like enzyme